jgi:hypothetical protein
MRLVPILMAFLVLLAGTASVAARGGSFDKVAGWGGVKLSMTQAETEKVLQRARVKFRRDEERVYPAPSKDGARDMPMHFSTPLLELTLPGGWTGRIMFDGMGGTMMSITLRSPALSAKAADAEVARLVRQYGKPGAETSDLGARSLTWQNPSCVLLVDVSGPDDDGKRSIQKRYARP